MLMERIEITDWLQLTQPQRYDRIRALQELRLATMAQSRVRAGGKT